MKANQLLEKMKIVNEASQSVLPSQNLEFGFMGTILSILPDDATAIWDEVSRELIKSYALTPEEAREFLDSRWGRHLADTFVDGAQKHLIKALIPEIPKKLQVFKNEINGRQWSKLMKNPGPRRA